MSDGKGKMTGKLMAALKEKPKVELLDNLKENMKV
jgi:hypothetical protein